MSSLNELLILACRNENFNLATELLLQQGADPNVRNINKWWWWDKRTPLHWGCWYGSLEFVKLLIETYKCNPEVRARYQQTPLHYACRNGHLNIVQYLISERGCNPEVRDSNQQTPFALACQFTHLKVIQFFIRQQNFNQDHIIDRYAKTILHCACQDGHLNIVQYLISEQGCNPEVRDSNQQTPLYLAYQNKHMEIVQFLIRQQNFNPDNTVNRYQQTLLHCACRDGQLNIVQYLISERGCNPEVKDSDQQTPLHYACRYGHLSIVQYIISEQGCNPEVSDKHQQTPLHYACRNSHLNIVQYPISEQGCNVDVQDKSGDTPLHCACRNIKIEVIKFLLIKGKCNPDLTNNGGDTALHIACRKDSLDVVKVLISEGKCNPDLTNNDGDTALHLACDRWWSSTSVVKYLLEEGNSNPNIKNKNEHTPLELTSDTKVIRELIRHGANPTNVYETRGKVVGTKQPLQSPVKVFVVGNPSAGKSTLTAALKKEKSLLARTFTSAKKVSGVDEKTAGVIPHDFVSKKSGPITLYDFAGQPEFYSSHAALLQIAIQTSPPIFLFVVDLCESNEEMKQTILYWLSFLENQCTSVSSKPHVIIVGSHADVLRARGEDPKQKSSVIDSLQKSYQFRNLHLSGLIVLDCQYSESTGMSELRECLKNSCDSLRNQETININAHCFFVYLLDKFRDSTAVKIKDIIPHIQRGKESANESEPLYFLPTNTSALCSLCDELNDRGHILFLKDPASIENSWVIIDKAVLLSEVTGTIFAPETFKQHCRLASSTGVVPVSNLAKTFPQHNIEMLVGFLSHLEFCHEITDQEVLQLASEQHQTTSEEATCSPSDRYLLFPALISLDVPCKVWESKPEFNYHCGWILQCSQDVQFFTSRFLQVLLLRLAFSFALTHHHGYSEVLALQRNCSIWKNGIFWGSTSGVEILVEVTDNSRSVIVIMRSREVKTLAQLRSQVIQKVLQAAKEFCAFHKTLRESIINPSETREYPLKPTSQFTLFSIKSVATSVVTTSSSSSASVVCPTGTLPLEQLVIFEPYAGLGAPIIQELLTETSITDSRKKISVSFLSQFSQDISHNADMYMSILGVSSSDPPHDRLSLSRTLEAWRDGCEGTYQCLREKLDKLSVFAGRNPLELADISITSTTADSSHVDLISHDSFTEVQPGQLTINDVGSVRKAVWKSRVKWYDLGIELSVPVDTLDAIEKNKRGDVEDCFTAMLKEWLKTNPTWSSLVEALKSPPVDYPQLAEEVFTNYVNTTSTPPDVERWV